jgi:histidine ammonia-lyase
MPTTTLTLTGRDLTIADTVRFARNGDVRVTVAPEAREALGRSRGLVEKALGEGRTIYGVNTGFGKLANVSIAPDRLDQLQLNLIRSHAAGMATRCPGTWCARPMLLRANVLLRPTSGVRPALADALVA